MVVSGGANFGNIAENKENIARKNKMTRIAGFSGEGENTKIARLVL